MLKKKGARVCVCVFGVGMYVQICLSVMHVALSVEDRG